jgi:hypothetical protein
VGDTSNKYYTFIGLPNATNTAAGGFPLGVQIRPLEMDLKKNAKLKKVLYLLNKLQVKM